MLSSPFHPSFLAFIYILYGQYLQRLFGRHTTLLSLDGLRAAGQMVELVYLYGNTSTHHAVYQETRPRRGEEWKKKKKNKGGIGGARDHNITERRILLAFFLIFLLVASKIKLELLSGFRDIFFFEMFSRP